MSTIREDVINAVNDGHTNVDDICEATGYEKRQVVNAIYQLKADKSCVATGEGLKIEGKRKANGEAGRLTLVDKPNGHAGPAAIAMSPKKRGRPKKVDAPPQARKARAAKRKVIKRVKRAPRAAAPDSGSLPIDFTYFGEFIVLRRKDLLELVRTVERWNALAKALT